MLSSLRRPIVCLACRALRPPMDFALLVASTVCYAVACGVALVGLRHQVRPPTWARIGTMALGFGFLCGFLYLRGQAHGRCPLTTGFEVLIFVSWAIGLLYFVVGPGFRLSLLGFFAAPLIVLFQGVGLFLYAPAEPILGPNGKPLPPDYWVEMHAALSLVAYGAFALAFVAGVMFLLQDRHLRSGNRGQLFYQLPPVHYLHQAIERLLWLGFILFSTGILAAFMMERLPEAHKLAAIGFVWLIYGLIILHKLIRGSGARRLASAAVFAFLFPVLSFWFL